MLGVLRPKQKGLMLGVSLPKMRRFNARAEIVSSLSFLGKDGYAKILRR